MKILMHFIKATDISILPNFKLETAVQDDKVMQDFELGSLWVGIEHSQKVKAIPIESDYSSKDCVNLSSSTAVFRFNAKVASKIMGLHG